MVGRVLVSAALVGLASCASGELVGDGGPIDARRTDAAVSDGPTIDARLIDAAAPVDAPAGGGGSLLLTEIVLAPTGGELVEVYNPGPASVDLTTYYLSDAPGYFRLPAGVAMVAADASDFVAKFPAGATLAARTAVVVAIDTGASYAIAYPGMTPTYSVGSDTMTVLTTGAATLTNAGEPLILFQWNGVADKVIDVDIMYAGTPTAANLLVAKTPVDGPDADGVASAYAADALTLPTQAAPAMARSTKRLALESAATETQSGGNGLGGHDETSEQTGITWDSAAYTAPTPGMVPAALMP